MNKLERLTDLHIKALARICVPEDRPYAYTLRLDSVTKTYYVAKQSTHLLYTIVYRKCYRKNQIIRDLMRLGLASKTEVVLYTRRKVRILEILYPTIKGEQTYCDIFGEESWMQYADPELREYRGFDEIVIDFTFRLRDLDKLRYAIRNWSHAVNIVTSAVCKAIQLLAALGYGGYIRLRVPKTGTVARALLLSSRSGKSGLQ